MTEPPGNGNVSFSVKELLQDLDRKVDGLFVALDSKADRERVHELISKLAAIEMSYVRRDGPIIQRLETFERVVDDLRRELVTKTEIEQALTDSRKMGRDERAETFTKREKMAGVVIAALAVFIPAINLYLRIRGVEGVALALRWPGG